MLNRLKTFFINYQRLVGRSRLRSYLLTLNDDTLADLGFSRDLLNKGVSKWPWKPAVAKVLSFEHKLERNEVYDLVNKQENEIQQAIAKLQSYSDQQLADLGIPRENIEFVVRNGRPRLDQDPRNHNTTDSSSIAA